MNPGRLKEIFVVRDYRVKDVAKTLIQAIAQNPPSGWKVVDLEIGETPTSGTLFEDVVKGHIDRAGRVLVLLDSANANVGFELGYALASGAPLILVTTRTDPPKWATEQALHIPEAGSPENVRRMLTEKEPLVHRPDANEPGVRTAFLCPQGTAGLSYRDSLATETPDWFEPKPHEISYGELGGLLKREQIDRVVWLIAAHNLGEGARDADENTTNALFSGYAYGLELELVVIRDESAREVADVVKGSRTVTGLDEFLSIVRELEKDSRGARGADVNSADLADRVSESSEASLETNSPTHSVESSESLSGSVLGERLHVQGRLGVGSMGTVYRAWDERLDRLVAIKVIEGLEPGSERLAAKLREEARLMAGLTHKNIVRFFDYDEYEAVRLLRMELVEGPSLEQLSKERHGRDSPRFAPSEVLWILEHSAAALDEARKQGIVHGDLKPANLLLTGHPEDQPLGGAHTRIEVKLADFGLGKHVRVPGSEPGAGTTVNGTPGFMAPQLYDGEDASHASDIYGLAATLFALVRGHPPFNPSDLGGDWYTLRSAVKEQEAPPAMSGSDALDRAVALGLSREVDQRPRTASALLEIARGQVRAAPPWVEQRSRRWPYLLAVIGLSAAALWLWDGRRERPWQGPRTHEDPETGVVFMHIGADPHPELLDAETTWTPVEPSNVRVEEGFFLARDEITRAQWKSFLDSSGHEPTATENRPGKTLTLDGKLAIRPGATWKNPLPEHDHTPNDDDPAVMLSLDDARAYCDYYDYRLPTATEWEYACRAGSEQKYWWGDAPEDGLGRGNFAGQELSLHVGPRPDYFSFDDGFPLLMPLGAKVNENKFKLRHMLGNAMEWCATPIRQESDEAIAARGEQPFVKDMNRDYHLRGGSWANGKLSSECSFVYFAKPDVADVRFGFRPAMDESQVDSR